MSGFVADPGTNFSTGQTPILAQRLDDLAKHLGITIHGISGYRTPSHSASLPGGSANDPHTQGKAADIGVNSSLRSSAAQLTDAQLRAYGLYRPFGGAQEINHIQLLPGTEKYDHYIPTQDFAKGVDPGLPIGAGAIKKAGGAVDQAVSFAKDPVGAIASAVSTDGVRVLLYVLLVGGGTALAVMGVSRAAGLHAPKVSTLAKGAAVL